MNNIKKLIPEYRFNEFKDLGEWQTVKLGDIADITKLAGYEYTKHIIYSNTGNIIALRVLNIKHNKLLLDNVMYIDNSEFNKLTRSKLYIGDILFTYIGTVGETAIVDKNDKYYLAPNVARIRCNDNYNPTFINFLCQTDAIQKTEINRFIATSSQPALSMGSLRQFSITIPTLDEQEKIADHLSTLDDLIDTQIKKLETFNKHKKGLLQKLLPTDQEKIPQVRFSEFKNLKDWQTVQVNDIMNLSRGNVISKKYINENPGIYPIYSSQTQDNGVFGHIDSYMYNGKSITWTTDGANAGTVFYRQGKFNYTNVCGLGIKKENINLNYYFIAEVLNKIAFKYVSYVGNPKLMNNVFAIITITIPPIEEQEKIAHCISSLDELINSQTNKIQTLKQYKNGLLQKLIPNNERD